MSMELLRLGLQFFAGETKGEDEEEVIIPGEEGVTGASGVTGNTAPAYTMPENLVSAPKAQDFDTWYKANGGMDEAGYYAKYDLDPERDYLNTVNTLNYEYQTSMANYGENAEKMYQMGLQNSGVSDIFQANAFSAYLGNMNQAAADRITARKKNKAAFEDYVAGMKAQHGQYETGIKTEYDTKLNSALTYAMRKYNGYNLQEVLNDLGVSGYYADIVDEIGKRLSGMDATSLQATTETVLAQDIINNIAGFTGSDNDLAAAISMYKGMYGEDVIGKAFERAKTIYQNSAEGQDQMVKDLVTSGQTSFDPNYSYIPTDVNGEQILDENGNATEIGGDGGEGSMNAFIKNVWGIETDPNAEGFDQSAYNRAVKAWEQMSADYVAKQPERVQEYVNKLYGAYQGYSNTDWDKYLANVPEGDREAVKQAILEQWKSDVGNAETAILNYINKLGLDYKGTQKQKADIKQKFGLNYNNHVIDYVLKSIDNTLGVYKEGYEDSPEGIQATVDEYVAKYGASFDPNYEGGMDAFIQNVMEVNTTDKESANYKAAVEAWNQMNNNIDGIVKEIMQYEPEKYGLSDQSTDEEVKEFLSLIGINNPSNAVISKLKKQLGTFKSFEEKTEIRQVTNRINEIQGINNISDVSLSEMASLLGRGVVDDTGTNSGDKILKEKAKEMLGKAVDNLNDLQNAWYLIGYDQNSWDELTDGLKLQKVIEAIGEYKKKGLVPEDFAEETIKEWLENQFYAASDSNEEETVRKLSGSMIDNNFITKDTEREAKIGAAGLKAKDLVEAANTASNAFTKISDKIEEGIEDVTKIEGVDIKAIVEGAKDVAEWIDKIIHPSKWSN